MSIKALKIATFITLISFGSRFMAKAQSTVNPLEHKWRIDFGGAIGLFAPFDQVGGEPMILGTTSQTTIQFNYKKQFFARVQLGETTVGYKSKSTFNGINSAIDANSSSTNLAFSFGYHRGLGSWTPFIVAGLGPALVRHPQAIFDAPSNTINYSNSSDLYLHGNLGLGVNYNLSKSVMLLLECQATKIPGLPKDPSPHLSGISALINVKIAL